MLKKMEQDNKWRLITHSYQIADTGDYDGYCEITNGDISLVTKSEIYDECYHIDELLDILNSLLDVKWELHNKYSDEAALARSMEQTWKSLADRMYEQLKLHSSLIVVKDHPVKQICKEYESWTGK
jgi:hypothetical protein